MGIWILAGFFAFAGACAVLFFLFWRPRQESHQLRQEFGPEYDRTVTHLGDRTRAEADLKARKERVSKLNLRSLDVADRARYAEEWRQIQARFVDEPSASLREADVLLAQVMRARGYPVEDYATQVSDLSVQVPDLVDNYRTAHAFAVRNERGDITTEELRRALVKYREVFAALLEEEPQRHTA
jgi:hypothetical protein